MISRAICRVASKVSPLSQPFSIAPNACRTAGAGLTPAREPVSTFLNCSQRLQRALLCLCQSLDPRDIESFIRPIIAQRLEMLEAVQVPDHDSTIITTTGELMTVGAYPER